MGPAAAAVAVATAAANKPRAPGSMNGKSCRCGRAAQWGDRSLQKCTHRAQLIIRDRVIRQQPLTSLSYPLAFFCATRSLDGLLSWSAPARLTCLPFNYIHIYAYCVHTRQYNYTHPQDHAACLGRVSDTQCCILIDPFAAREDARRLLSRCLALTTLSSSYAWK